MFLFPSCMLQPFNMLTSRELKADDIDTSPPGLQYVVTVLPQHGHLELTSNPTVAISTFTQGIHMFILQICKNVRLFELNFYILCLII